MKINLKTNKGITLIALVITIIVLLILAGVTIAMLTGDNGILTRAQSTKVYSDYFGALERAELAYMAVRTEVATQKAINGTYKATEHAEELKEIARKDVSGNGFTGISLEDDEENANNKVIVMTYSSTSIKQGVIDPDKPRPKNDGHVSFEITITEDNKVEFTEDGEAVAEGGTEATGGNTGDSTDDGETARVLADNEITNSNLKNNSHIKEVREGEVPVPKGTYYVGGTKDTGFVISDSPSDEGAGTSFSALSEMSGNQWVWIPVADATAMYSTGTYTLTGETGQTTAKASKGGIISDNNGSITRTTPPGTSDPYYREPDLVTDYDNDSYAQTAGFENLSKMAEGFVTDYNAMIDSVAKYKGFYVGRFELGGSTSSPVVKKGAVLTNVTWYELYNACNNFSTSDVTSTMIWGVQWDIMCKFISEKGEQKDITNSSSWGNYYDNTVSGHGELQNTGYAEEWCANKIYDVAGNAFEWTQEAYDTCFRAHRGGYYYSNGSDYPASYRDYGGPGDIYGYGYSSRPTLYIK